MKGLKKVVSLALAICMVFGVSACGNKKKSEDKDYINYVYARDDSFADIGGDNTVFWYSVIGESLYYCNIQVDTGSVASDSDASETDALESYTYIFYKADLNGASAEKIAEKKYDDGSMHISTISTSPDGTIYFYDEGYDENSTSTLYKYDGSQFVEVGDFNKVIQESNAYLSGFFPQDDGSIIAVFGDSIKKYDQSLNEVSTLPLEIYVENVSVDKDNNIIIRTTKESTDADAESTLQFVTYDAAQNKLGTTYDLDMNAYSAGQVTPGFGDYNLLIRSSSGLYGYKYSDGKREKIVDYYASNIASDSVYRSFFTDKDNLYFMYETDGEATDLVRYKKVDPKEVADRKVLTLAMTNDAHDMKKLVRRYNDSQTKYTVQIVDYSEESNPDSKLGADISAGKVPDLYVVDSGIAGQPIQKHVSKGLLEDLTPYIEKDEELSMEDFIPAVIDSLKVDGKLYFVTPRVSLNTLVGNGAEIGMETGWTAEEMKEYVESKPEGSLLLEMPSKDSLLYNLMIGTGYQFVDWGKGECHFDSADFKNIMEMCNRGAGDEDLFSADSSTASLIQSKKLLLSDILVAPDDIIAFNKLYNGKASFKGFPVSEGSGSYFSAYMGIAMSAKCDDKDGAWDFIRTMLLKDTVADDYMFTSMVPIREDVYQMKMDTLTTTKEYTDEYGNTVTPREGTDSPYGVEIDTKPLTDDDIKAYRTIIDSTDHFNYYDPAVMEIVSEEAAAYFSGDKSLDDVCNIIQDRATTYINENK